jgi:hypothetical protein
MRLLPEEASFFFWAAAQLAPDAREVFAERVASILAGHPDPGPGDCNRAVRAALTGLWEPPVVDDPSRWGRASPRFERVSRSQRGHNRVSEGAIDGERR